MQDIKIDSNGEVTQDYNLDLERSQDLEYYSDQILIRLRTPYNSARWMPDVGSLIHTLIGLPNTRETGRLAEEYVNDALTRDSFLSNGQFEVNVVPINENSIGIYVDLTLNENQDDETIQFVFSLDLYDGNITIV
jgi:phage baseplate assembly protein W